MMRLNFISGLVEGLLSKANGWSGGKKFDLV
jgi:hypothetical protein